MQQQTTHEKRLTWALVITFVVLVGEVVGGILTNSLALLSDSLHVLLDLSSVLFDNPVGGSQSQSSSFSHVIRCQPTISSRIPTWTSTRSEHLAIHFSCVLTVMHEDDGYVVLRNSLGKFRVALQPPDVINPISSMP
jgi:hypothetical protein